jgi:hypothetical protein
MIRKRASCFYGIKSQMRPPYSIIASALTICFQNLNLGVKQDKKMCYFSYLTPPPAFIKKSRCAYFLRTPSDIQTQGGTDRIAMTDGKQKEDTQIGKLILCRGCLQVITDPSEKIMVHGSHTHTFANPNGIVFDIDCYRSAVGCGYVGQPTAEFSWFKGFMWRISVCSACLTHLGWLFTAADKNSFLGLIQNRLIQAG